MLGSFLAWLLAAIVLTVLLVTLRLLQVLRQTHASHAGERVHGHAKTAEAQTMLVAFLGSGGHTGEMIRLLYGLDFERYSPRLYLVSTGDSLSLAKITELENARLPSDATDASKPAWSVLEIPRARRVHQSFLTAPFTTVQSFAACFRILSLPSLTGRQPLPGLVLLNGPGSCVPIAIAAFLPRLLNLHSPRCVYIESMARVKRLSLSGKILRLFVDRFFVQWKEMADETTMKAASGKWWLAQKEYRGILV